MDVWQITVAALRRWYVLLPLLALTAWGVVTVGESVEPEYEVQASAMVTPERREPTVPNPYDGLDQATQVLEIVLAGPDMRERLAADGLTSPYEVNTQTRSTIVRLVVRGETVEQAVGSADALLAHAADELARRQAAVGLAPEEQYRLDVLVRPSLTDVVYNGKLRVQAVVGFVGAALSLLVAVLFDDIVGIVRRARARRRASQARTARTAESPAESPADGGDVPAAPVRGGAGRPLDDNPANDEGEQRVPVGEAPDRELSRLGRTLPSTDRG